MQFVCLTYYFLLILISGYILVSLIFPSRDMSFEKVFSLSGLSGLGIMAFLLFYVDLALPGSSRIFLLLLPVPLAIALYFILRKKMFVRISGSLLASFYGAGEEKMILFLPAAVIVSSLVVVVAHSFFTPLYEWDAFAIWFLKAKILYSEDIWKTEYFMTLPLSYSHLDYPLLLPYLIKGIYSICGGIDEVIARSIFPFLYLCFLFLIISILSEYVKKMIVMILAAFYFSIPAVIRWWGSGSADMLLAAFNFCSVYFIFDYLRGKGRGDIGKIVIAFVFAAFAAFTKNEGLPLAVINIIVLMVFLSFSSGKQDRLRQVIPWILIPVMLILPWLIFSHDIPRTHENYGERMNFAELAANFWKMKLIVPIFSEEFANFANWGILWLVTGILLLRFKACAKMIYLWSVLILYVILFALVFSVSPWSLEFLATTALGRLLLQISPVAFFIVAISVSDILGGESKE